MDVLKHSSFGIGQVLIHILALVWFPTMAVIFCVFPGGEGAENAVLEEVIITEDVTGLGR